MPRKSLNPFTKIPNDQLEHTYRCKELPPWYRIQCYLNRKIEGYHKDYFDYTSFKAMYEEIEMSKRTFERAFLRILNQGNYMLDWKTKRIYRLYPKVLFSFDNRCHFDKIKKVENGAFGNKKST